MLSFAKKNHQKFIPRHPSQEDIYLVSFPKSGNTWLRFLLATAIKLHYDIKREVNFFSIHDIIPDVWISRDIRCQGIFGESALPRILKSHSSHNPYYHRVLLLVRDPRDTLISYYYYLSNYGKVDLDKLPFSEFIKDNKYGVQAWLKHTDSWLKVNRPAQIIRVFRYEDLLQDPEKQLYLMLDLIGIPVDFDKIKLAIEL
ncbi:MAG: sulfotransferase domain-containing protein, partial [Cyanobacteria bacterium J06635_15]